MQDRSSRVLEIDEFILDLDATELRKGDAVVEIEPQVFDLIVYFARNAGRVVSRDELIDAVWQGRIVSDSAISTRISAARSALGDDGKSQRFIKTIHGRGFRFAGGALPGAAGSADPAPHPSERTAIAVLPFKNLSGDEGQEYFADGLTDELITTLCRWRRYAVIARNSTNTFKGQSPDIRKVGEDLGARYVVEGSVRRSGDRVRVSAQLIDAQTGHHIWADRYDRVMDDIFAIQDEIAQQVASIIEPTIDHTERLRISGAPVREIDAWEHALRGFLCIYEGGEPANNRAMDLFRRAIDLDSRFARAHSGLSYCYIRDIRYFRHLDRADALRLADEHAKRAVQLDEHDAEAHAMLARTCHLTGQREMAVAEARRAVDLNPFDPFANNIYGAMLGLASTNYDAAIPWFEKAHGLNPLDPQQYLYLTQQAFAELGAGRYEDAVAHGRHAAHKSPSFLEAHIVLTAALGHLGRGKEHNALVDGIGKRAPDYIRGHVFFCADLKDRVLAGLEKAGVAI